MKKILVGLMTLSFSASLLAQAVSTASTQSVLQRLKDSPVSLTIDAYLESAPDVEKDKKFNGSTLYLDSVLGFKLTEDDSVALLTESVHKDAKEVRASNELEFVMLKYKRALSKQDEDGVNSSVEVRPYYMTNDEGRDSSQSNGGVQARLNFSRKVTDSLTLASTFRHYHYIKKTGAADSEKATTMRAWRLYLSGSYDVTDKIGLGLLGLYVSSRNNKRQSSGEVVVQPTLSYAINDTFTLTAGVESNLFSKPVDGTFSRNHLLVENFLYSINLTTSVF